MPTRFTGHRSWSPERGSEIPGNAVNEMSISTAKGVFSLDADDSIEKDNALR
jgi:hypothetical protein